MHTSDIPLSERKYMSDLHFDHSLWSKQMQFFTDELKIFEHRLEEVAAANTNTEVTAQIEHFQNQFIRQKEVIDELNHKINAHETVLVEFAKDHPVAVDHHYFADHSALRDEVQIFNKIWYELRSEFLRFVGTWL